MESGPRKIANLQRKSHEALLKLLNNIGAIGAILTGIADLVFVLVIVFGVHVDAEISALVIFALVNAGTGLLINVLLRYQGQKYAELENAALCKRFYNKRVKEKKYLSMGAWFALKTLQDVLVKGCTAAFSIFGVVYISITGSKNPIQILLTFGTLILFACFGLMAMNSAYIRFYNIQIPYMKQKIADREGISIDEITDEYLGEETIVEAPVTEPPAELETPVTEEIKTDNEEANNAQV